jgi:hypothetical protein
LRDVQLARLLTLVQTKYEKGRLGLAAF